MIGQADKRCRHFVTIPAGSLGQGCDISKDLLDRFFAEQVAIGITRRHLQQCHLRMSVVVILVERP